MPEYNGKHIIRSLQKKWIWTILLSTLLRSAGIALLMLILLHSFFDLAPWWGIVVFAGVFVTLFIPQQSWKISDMDISRFLDHAYPQLEESSSLALKPVESLSLLEKLQVKKTEPALAGITKPPQLNRKLFWALGLFIFAVILYVVTPRGLAAGMLHATPSEPLLKSVTPSVPEKKPAQVALLSVKIVPPGYTKRPAREQDKFNLEIEEGAAVRWQVKTTAPVTGMQFIFNDSLSLSLHPADDSKMLWSLDKNFSSAGYYQVKIGDNLSDLYKIELIKDQPPLIHIKTPKQYTTIDFGDPQQVQADVDVSDDYGIRDAYITATIANGAGEAVKFKEQKLFFPGFSAGNQKYQLQKLLQLSALGMVPGDELYFYVNAIDNHNQESRSDVYIINIQDTAQLMTLDGLTFGINVKPDFFRSERQIIIETEQLIKDKNRLNIDSFKTKSNDLGIDQKLLRLRYGKFLGEESSSDNSGAQENGQGALSDPKNFGNAAVVLDEFTDKHDNAEDATFFDPELKKQLKATLTEMWNAELPLRTYRPEDALPYEYKALRLLKDLQQKSRAYVAKTSFKSATLKPEKRLTGDLAKIGEPIYQQDYNDHDQSAADLRSAIGILELLKTGKIPTTGSFEVLSRSSQQLSKKAVAEPAIYLAPAQALRKILGALHGQQEVNKEDLSVAESGLERIMPPPDHLPAAEKNSANQLSQQYFIHLKQPDYKQ